MEFGHWKQHVFKQNLMEVEGVVVWWYQAVWSLQMMQAMYSSSHWFNSYC
jgi:hypothetical protein